MRKEGKEVNGIFFFFVSVASDWKKIKSISTENMKVIFFSLQIFNVIVSIEVSFF